MSDVRDQNVFYFRRWLLFWLLSEYVFVTHAATPPAELYSPLLAKINNTGTNFSTSTVYPEYTDSQGQWLYFPTDGWTTGFLPSTLYALNTRLTLCPNTQGLNSTDWLTEARHWSTPEVPLETNNTQGHDVGFLSFPFQEELKVDPTNQTAQDAVNAFANDLAARFDPIVGCTRSWDTSDPTDFTVIIDNMMNLEVLFASANLTGNDTLRQIATSHADKTMQNQIRDDGSSFHVVEYNSTTGEVIRKRTSQGYADNSTWTRGQAWGLYGFAQMYQSTGNQTYLDVSRSMATYFINHVPSTGLVPWDFDAPDDGTRTDDTSAAMIAATGMLLLSSLERSLSPANDTGAEFWNTTAIELLSKTTAAYWEPNWQSLLSNGTVNNRDDPPINNTGIIYGNYYFLVAGNMLLADGTVSCDTTINLTNATGSSGGNGGNSSPAQSAAIPLIYQNLGLTSSIIASFIALSFWTA